MSFFSRQGVRLGLVLMLGFIACKPSGRGDFSARLQFLPDPPQPPQARLVLDLIKDGRPLEAQRVRVEANMLHPGMAPVFAQATPLGNGRFVIERFRIDPGMSGDWIFTIQADVQGQTLKADVPLQMRTP